MQAAYSADVIVESGRLNISDTLTVSSLRIPVGYQTGYVLTSDANGYGIWQTVGGTPLGGGWFDAGTKIYLQTLTDTVGIGTINPAGELHISSNYPGGGNFTFNGASLSMYGFNDQVTNPRLPYIQWLTPSGQRAMYLGYGSTNTPKYLNMMLENGYNLYIDGGNVGIGTTGPSEKLHVVGDIRIEDNNRFEWGDSTVAIDGSGASDYIRFYTSNAEKMRIDSDGDVGIGTTNPGYKLHVSGDVGFTGTLQAGTVPWARISGAPAFITDDTSVLKSHLANSGTLGFQWVDSEVSDTLTASSVPWNGVSSKPTSITRILDLTGSYGSINIAGTSGGYAGINFQDEGIILMMDGTGATGVYTGSAWKWYFDTSGALTAGTVPWGRITGAPAFITDGNTGWDNSYGYITDGNTGWDNSYGYITDGNTGWTNDYGFITDGNTGWDNSYGFIGSGGSPTFTDVYATSWFRNDGAEGMYNSAYDNHFYSESASYWTVESSNGMIFRNGYAGAVQGYVYNDGTGFGLLNNQGSWMLYSPDNSVNVYFPAAGQWVTSFITDGNTGWTNDYGFITDGNSGWGNEYGFITGSSPSISSARLTGNTEIGSSGAYIRATSNLVLNAAPGASTFINYDSGSAFYVTGHTTTGSAANVQMAASGLLSRVTSSRRYKTDIESIKSSDALRVLMGLRAVTYKSNNTGTDDPTRKWAGFIAEEVAQLEPILADFDPDGTPNYVTYDRVPAYLVPVAQEHEARINNLEQTVKKLSEKIESQEEKIENQQKEIEQLKSKLKKD